MKNYASILYLCFISHEFFEKSLKDPFPSLYDSFFEAVREDFEFRLRSAILAVGRGLLAEGDAAAAETILRRGYMALPEDEEIGDFLRESLIAQGKHVEAERLKAMAEG